MNPGDTGPDAGRGPADAAFRVVPSSSSPADCQVPAGEELGALQRSGHELRRLVGGALAEAGNERTGERAGVERQAVNHMHFETNKPSRKRGRADVREFGSGSA